MTVPVKSDAQYVQGRAAHNRCRLNPPGALQRMVVTVAPG
jgi:hypothetical protein